MNKNLTKKYKESEKIQKQILALQEKLQGVDNDAMELEKTELHKIFKSTKISFEEYTQIIEGFLNNTHTETLKKEKNYYSKEIKREDINNEQ